MTSNTRAAGLLTTVVCVLTMGMAGVGRGRAEPVARTVYVSVTDAQGAPVTDLTPADFTVKEGGKEREVTAVEPAKAKARVALLIENRLVADGSIRVGMFEFIKRMQGTAEVAIITVGMRNTIVVNYTTSAEALVQGLNQLTLNPGPDSNLTEGILELAKAIDQDKKERPAIVALAFSGGQSGGALSKDVLDRLRQSGATMFAVTLGGAPAGGSGGVGALGDESNREQVLGDGPKQSGGRRFEIVATAAAQKALQQIAGDLLGQYAVHYTLPDGTKPDKRFSASLKRKGLTLRAPSVIPDK